MSLKKYNLKQVGLKITQQRLKILNIFENSTTIHLSADDVYKILNNNNEEIGIATVYRILSQFESVGLLHKIKLGLQQQSFYELNSNEDHDHIICVKCNTVINFIDKDIEKIKLKVIQNLGGKAINHIFVLYVKCKNCF